MASKTIVTPEFRLSFPSLFKPTGFNNQDPKFSATMLFAPGANLDAMREAAREAAHEKFGAKLPPSIRSPFRKGEEKEHLDGYEPGVIFVRASSSAENPPEVVDRLKQPILSPRDIYAGAYCRAVVVPFAYDTSGNKGVSFGLRVIQKLRDGESFSGAGVEALDDLPEDDSGAAAPGATEGDDFLEL